MVRAPLRQVRCQGCCRMRPDCTWTDPFICFVLGCIDAGASPAGECQVETDTIRSDHINSQSTHAIRGLW
jgi:hypothetical protein